MDIREIREKLTIVNVTSMTSESVADYEHDVDEYVRLLERQLEQEEEKKVQIGNRIGVVQSQVAELWDRVDKARRRETDISYRVTAWAQHLSQLMNEVKLKRAQMGMTMDSSAILSAEIQQSLDVLAEKRDLVERMAAEIEFRRRLHTDQLKQLNADCDDEKEKCSNWDAKSDEIEKAISILKEQRKVLGERILDDKRMEEEQKKMLEELEMLMRKANLKKRQSVDGANLVGSFSTLTGEESS